MLFQSLISASISDNTVSEASDINVQPRIPPQPRMRKERHQEPASPRDDNQRLDLPEYKAAIELELWKEQQEENFKTMVR